MQKFFKPARMVTVFAAMAVLLAVYVSALYKMQIYDAALSEGAMMPSTNPWRTETLTAPRGNIYDRNGILLVTSRTAYNIVLTRDDLIVAPDVNDIILKLIYLASESGVKYNDSFPVTQGAPFTYVLNMTGEQRRHLEIYIDYFKALEPGITASSLLVWMKSHYKIDMTTGISDTRLISGVRYELESRVLPGVNVGQYVFAEDVSAEFVSIIMEQGFPGISVEKTSVREYKTERAAHIIGFTGKLDDRDSQMYQDLGYPLDAYVGKSGAEQAFEGYLHGTDGKQSILTSRTGEVLDVRTVSEPIPGDNVYLSIDIGLQAQAEDALSSFIDIINQDPERTDNKQVPGGAIVIEDVRTGEVLACASYPTYDLSTYRLDYNSLSSDPRSPLINRATDGIYNPGSTFKMVSALSGLRTGTISQWTVIDDVGRFTKYPSYQPTCWIYTSEGHGHGPLDVVGALEKSCNYFFYQLADLLDPTNRNDIPNLAAEFGLGSKTGLEIPELSGTLATPEYKRARLNESWVTADTLLSSIGQSYNQFTPVQLANYAATIANNGTRYSMTLLSHVKSADFSKLLYSHSPSVMGTVNDNGYMGIIQRGMRAVASTGTAAAVFGNYPIKIAAKTGTVQSDASEVNNGVFVCYAPADNPEIAISIVVEKGTSGSTIMQIGKSVLDYYFLQNDAVPVITDGELIP